MAARARGRQAPGTSSTVYTPVLLAIFKKYHRKGAEEVTFTLEDIRAEAIRQKVDLRNAPDLIYRMKSRTAIPEEIQRHGFRILTVRDRGKYAFLKADSTLIDHPEIVEVQEIEDRTPPEIRRLMHPDFGSCDEQEFLSILRYNDVFSLFLEGRVLHLKSHVRRSVPGVGQVEVDDVHVVVWDDGLAIVPVEAKAKDDPVNRAQIAMQVRYAQAAFQGCPTRPVTVKLFENGTILLMEFNPTTEPRELEIRRHRYIAFKRRM